MRRVKDQDEEGKGPGDQEDPGTRGPRDQGTKGPEDQGTRGRGLEDHGTRGTLNCFSCKSIFLFQYHPGYDFFDQENQGIPGHPRARHV